MKFVGDSVPLLYYTDFSLITQTVQALRFESLKIPCLFSLFPSHRGLTLQSLVQLCPCSTKAVKDNKYINRCIEMCFNKTLLKKQQQGAVRNGLRTIVCQPLVRREDSHNYKTAKLWLHAGVHNSQWVLREKIPHLASVISYLRHWLAFPTRWQEEWEV